MGSAESSRNLAIACEDCASGRIRFLDEQDLDDHAMSVHWCSECVKANRQLEPFASYRDLQTHVICDCASLSGLASRTRGMSIYDSSATSANIRKRFLPQSFEGHQFAGLSTDFVKGSTSNRRRKNWSVGSTGDLHDQISGTESGVQSTTDTPEKGHCYYFDVVVPGTEMFEEDEIMGAATTICIEAASQILRGRCVTHELCNEIIHNALMSDEAERNRSISGVYMRPRYRDDLEVIVDKRDCKLISYLEPGDRGYPSGRFLSSPRSSQSASMTGETPMSEDSDKLADWEIGTDPEGSPVYTNKKTGARSYEKPSTFLKKSSFKVQVGSSWGSHAYQDLPDRDSPEPPSRQISSRSASIDSSLSVETTDTALPCFNMDPIFRLQEYSKTQPLVAMLSRSPNTSLLLFFDPHGRATMFLPFVESCLNCAFFGFDTGFDDHHAMEALQFQMQEEFPMMTDEDAVYSLRKHWNEFRLTVFRLDKSVDVENFKMASKTDPGPQGGTSDLVYKTERNVDIKAKASNFMSDLDGHFRPSVIGISSSTSGSHNSNGNATEALRFSDLRDKALKDGEHRHPSRLTSHDLKLGVDAYRSSSLSKLGKSPKRKSSRKSMPALSSAVFTTERPSKHLSLVVEDTNENSGNASSISESDACSTDRRTFVPIDDDSILHESSLVTQLRSDIASLKNENSSLKNDVKRLQAENDYLKGALQRR